MYQKRLEDGTPARINSNVSNCLGMVRGRYTNEPLKQTGTKKNNKRKVEVGTENERGTRR